MKLCTVVLAGFGNVGRSLAKLILDRREVFLKKYRLDIRIVAVGDSGGFVYKPEGFAMSEIEKLLASPRGGVTKTGVGPVSREIERVLDETVPDFLVELTPANYETGEPGLTYITTALKRGVSVVTANKAPLVLRFRHLHELAARRRAKLGYRATVFGGVPVIDIIRHLAAHKIRRIVGILNATTNFILSKVFYEGYTLAQAIEEARRIGVMEANPALDLEGIDAAAKAVILANVAGLEITLDQVRRRGITEIKQEDIEKCKRESKVLKLIAEVDFERGQVIVEPREIPSDDDLAQVKYLLNAVKIETDYNTIFLKGVGGGPFETAVNVLSELVELALRED